MGEILEIDEQSIACCECGQPWALQELQDSLDESDDQDTL
jgi:hypothetical protein